MSHKHFIYPGYLRVIAKRRKAQIIASRRLIRDQGPVNDRSNTIVAKLPVWRSLLLLSLLVFCFISLAGYALYLTTNPLNQLRAHMMTANQPLDALSALIQQSDRLDQLSKNIENISIALLKQELDRSVMLANLAAKEFDAQSKSWSEMRGKIKQDNSTYDALRMELAELEKIQKDQIVRFKQVISEAERPSILADIRDLFLTFILGVLSSLIASSLYKKWHKT